MIMPGRKTTPALKSYRAILKVVDWILPPTCAGCGKAGERLCKDCDGGIVYIERNYCTLCGLPHVDNGICHRCVFEGASYDASRSLGIYVDTLRNAIIKLKYKRDYGLGETLASKLLHLLYRTGWEIDYVIPIPLGKERNKERGYNQAALLARPIAMGIGVPMQTKYIQRHKETRTQVGLSERERAENVFQAFGTTDHFIKGRNYLLIDDVMTTGATINACARSMKVAGGGKVYALTIARAMDINV